MLKSEAQQEIKCLVLTKGGGGGGGGVNIGEALGASAPPPRFWDL